MMRQIKTERVNIKYPIKCFNEIISWKQGSSFQVEKLVSPLLNEQFIIHVYIRDARSNFKKKIKKNIF